MSRTLLSCLTKLTIVATRLSYSGGGRKGLSIVGLGVGLGMLFCKNLCSNSGISVLPSPSSFSAISSFPSKAAFLAPLLPLPLPLLPLPLLLLPLLPLPLLSDGPLPLLLDLPLPLLLDLPLPLLLDLPLPLLLDLPLPLLSDDPLLGVGESDGCGGLSSNVN
jgi:hypothetical protein